MRPFGVGADPCLNNLHAILVVVAPLARVFRHELDVHDHCFQIERISPHMGTNGRRLATWGILSWDIRGYFCVCILETYDSANLDIFTS